MRAGIGNVGKINGKVFFAIGTPVYGKNEINVDRSSGLGIAEVVESSCCGASSRTTLPAEGTGSVLAVAGTTFLVGWGQINCIVYSDTGIGTIFTGTGHNESIRAGLTKEVYAISQKL